MSRDPYIRPVLVGIDGTPSGLQALSLGKALAVLSGRPLVLGSVYGYEVEGVKFSSLVWPDRDEADKWLEPAEQQVGDLVSWRSVTTMAPSIAQGLIRLAEAEDAAILVLGASRHGPIGRMLAGTGATRVVHGAPCAVAVVPHGWTLRAPDEPLVFGVAVDDGPESREALAAAVELAKAPHASVKVISASHLISPAHPLFAATGTSYSGWVRERHEHMEQVAREAAEAAGVDDVEVLEGDPVARLVEASEDLDLLFVGSRRYGPLRSVLLGSVSSALVERSHCPVLVVPRGVRASVASGESVPPQRAHA